MRAGEFGVMVPPENPPALAEGVLTLLREHQRRVRNGRAGREFIRRRRTWPRAAREFADALAAIV
jgi:glycosyltransferase involved in cell wall biosynthesis